MRRMRWVAGVGVLSGLIALGCTVFLISDHAAGVKRALAGSARITELEQQVKVEAASAPLLEEERKRQTEESLQRQTRNRRLAWTLLAAAGLFIACARVYLAHRPQRLPSLDRLTAIRFTAPDPTGVNRAGRAAVDGGRSGNGSVTTPGAVGGVDLAFVDQLVARVGTSREAAIIILQAIQTHYRYLPDEALQRVCELTDITPAQVAGTSSFYAQFRRSPVGRYVVRVCHGTACHVAGVEKINDELRRHLDIPPGEDTDPRRMFTLDKVACLGCCSLAPVMMIEEETAGHLTPASARQALDNLVVTT